MAIIMEQRAQLLQSLGSIATSAANAAAEGIAEAAKTDSKTVETTLKLFGGFDRSEFENISMPPVPNLLVPAVRPAASYEGPAEYFKPLSNTMQDQGFLVPAKDLLQQLEDPRFRMADGLSGLSDNRITQTLMQKGMTMSGPDENGISIVGGKPADPGDMVGSLDSFGKLYMMENTVAKQLQLHEQLDFGALGRFSAPKPVPISTADSPKLDKGLKGLPDVQAAAPQSKEILNVLGHALFGTPETVGELVQMLDVLQAEVQELFEGTSDPSLRIACLDIQLHLSNLKAMCEKVPADTPVLPMLLEYFRQTREAMRILTPIG